jgi:hypothetical protein
VRPALLALACALACASSVACGSGGDDPLDLGQRALPTLDSASCSDPVTDPVDPRSLTHVLPGASTTYETDPPTSGPHQPVPPSLSGVLDEPLAPAQQVGVLERGSVLVHFRPDEVDDDDLAPIAGRDVLVMPNPDLAEPVVATAWAATMRCTAVDPADLQAFIDAVAGRNPEGHG